MRRITDISVDFGKRDALLSRMIIWSDPLREFRFVMQGGNALWRCRFSGLKCSQFVLADVVLID
jgi:hypothetical protein